MNKVFVFALISLFIISAISCQKKNKTLEATLHNSVVWMWRQQSPDGGWHSETHAVLRDGRVLTPYILFHLLLVPKEIFEVDQKAVDKAIEFIIREMRSSFNIDSSTLKDYPNYSAAYALRVLYKLERDTALQQSIAAYFHQQQFIQERGFSIDSLAFGGWGYGESNLKHGEHGHVDISHTRRIAEALIETGNIKTQIKEDVFLFLKGVQRSPEDLRLYKGCVDREKLPYDGGFISSAVTLATNKSQPYLIDSAGYHYPSYATATCDGLLAMHALSLHKTSTYQDASKWLIANQQMHTIDGLTHHPEQWDEVMHFYHLSVRSEAMSIIDPDGGWQDTISRMLIEEQLPEGYFINHLGGINKEDDPLMATIFAIQAGGNCLE